jgi:HSP20 family molecular chaperone IbpA
MRMRYRHVRYRYTEVVTPGQSQAIADFWRIGGSGMILAHSRWRPDADVYETPTDVVITVDLAGVDENEMEVLLFEDALVVEGRRGIPGCEPSGVYHAVGIRQGPFRLEVPLQVAVDREEVATRYEQGLLRIRLRKSTGGEDHAR